MPNYDYSCATCDVKKEVNKPFSEADSVELCDNCNNPMNKVYGSFGISLKGPGFYSTDNPK
jgi:putative FmdB family regulatory protein